MDAVALVLLELKKLMLPVVLILTAIHFYLPLRNTPCEYQKNTR